MTFSIFGFGQTLPTYAPPPPPLKLADAYPAGRRVRRTAKMVERICAACGRVFTINACRVKSNSGRSCSIPCRTALRAGRPTVSTRTLLLGALAVGGLTAADLARATHMSPPSAMKGLQAMSREGIVEPRLRLSPTGAPLRGAGWWLVKTEAAE